MKKIKKKMRIRTLFSTIYCARTKLLEKKVESATVISILHTSPTKEDATAKIAMAVDT